MRMREGQKVRRNKYLAYGTYVAMLWALRSHNLLRPLYLKILDPPLAPGQLPTLIVYLLEFFYSLRYGRTLVIMTPIETCVKTSNFKKFPLINRIVEVF